MEIVLIRHTPTAAREGTCYGHLDLPLADDASASIAATLANVARTDEVFSSPSQRCALLARALAERDSSPLTLVPQIQELNFGAWEGLSWSDIPRTLSDPWAEDTWNRAPPGGETEEALWERVDAWRKTALVRTSGRVAIVAHGGSLRILRCQLLGLAHTQRWSWHMGYGAAESITTRS